MATITRRTAWSDAIAPFSWAVSAIWAAIAYTVLSTIAALIVWQERVRQRQMLAAMDERSLRDVGLSRADIARETDKNFWQA